MEAKAPPALLPPPLRGLPALSADIFTTRPPTSSLKYGDVQPSEFHSTAALAAWVAKWPAGQMEVDNIFTIGVRGAEEGCLGRVDAGKFIDPTPILGEN